MTKEEEDAMLKKFGNAPKPKPKIKPTKE